jgi:hypothetical protein
MKIEIKELDSAEVEKICEPLISFNPERCLGCGSKTGIVQRFFLLNVPATKGLHKQIKKALMDKFGLTYYALCEDNKKIITTAKCSECDGEKMHWDS